ncbi:hypothetical protein TanjilG_02933 [Lupinus angustifolius]|uniref:Uncharacterized protein n=2 Tax=Lupinus angustifolius TaxID=3871 RepID=A0A1J7GUW5_LUPAN|nr:hypothetical protein TanjilG_02933 [Lupinus angustifolius]
MGSAPNYKPKLIHGSLGNILEDVPQLSKYTPHLLSYSNSLEENPAYSVVK